MSENQTRYFIAKPNKTRRVYVLVSYRPLSRSKREYLKLSESLQAVVDRINRDFKAGSLHSYEAEALLKDLILKQYKKNDVRDMVLKNSVISATNQKVFNEFWDQEYSTRFLEDEKSAQYDLQKAIRLIEPLSLRTATAHELQSKLKKSASTVAEQRRAIDRLNQILKYLHRDFKLQKPKEGIRSVQHLKKAEFDLMLLQVEDPTASDLLVTLFATGMRLSEAMALEPDDIFDDCVNVTKQRTRKGQVKLPKRDKTGASVILTFGIEHVERWAEFEDKEFYRYRIFGILLNACQKAFPQQRSKWVGPHDLRHSHAVYLLGRGADLTKVALNLRNRIDVCQKYYTGFAHTDDTLDGLKRLLE